MTIPSRLAALTLTATLLSAGAAATPDARTVDNLRAFARLYGYVRFFHPSDEAAGVDWDAFAVYGAAKVMAVDAGGDLAAALRELFVPVAPTLRVFPAGEEPPPPAYDWPASTDGLQVVAWQHVGVGLGPGIYRSVRSHRGDAPLLFATLPEPGERIREKIGAGLVVDLPLALWSDHATTLGKNPAFPAGPLLAELAAFNVGAAGDAAVHAGAVTVAWNVFQHFYPYFDVAGVDWNVQLTARLAGALAARDAEEQYHNLRRLTAALADGHANVYHPGLLSSRAGVPLRLAWVEGEVVVTASGVDGVARGDVLASVDGEPAAARLEREVELSSGTPQWRRHRALWAVTSGDKDAPARLVVRRGGEELTVTAARDRAAQPPPEFDRPSIDVLEEGVVYVDLRAASIEEIEKRIDELAAAPGVVFDLRGYPNGNHAVLRHLTAGPIQSAKWNVSRIIYPDRKRIAGWRTDGRWTLTPAAPRLSGKLAFLTDGSAISYAESVMGIVEAYRLAAIVGETTAGANGNVNPFQLPGGYRVTWTGMKVLKHDDSPHHLVGIAPTVPCTRTLAGVRAGRDEQLEKALEVVRGD